ncbi:MAG: AbrB/MazE/SpoVT family DNA-binding domain-containing protein [Lentisphaeria bacterium]|nr:AbrB/MazE/SpoVT family DNA-binding domain-containing protein [Lentisphaeria bacterium]NQZ71352.1 AbrB/MazE/SpoVT family DNA-binding domain-containing protein [Lentisphaeria bacterium]
MIATLTAKGQVTLPKSIRQQLGLNAGDKVDFVLLENGVLQLVPLKQSPRKLKGIISKPSNPVSIEEMNRSIASGTAGS